MVGHGGSSAGSYLDDPTSPIPSHCAVIILFKQCPGALIIVTRTVRIYRFHSSSLLTLFMPLLVYIYIWNVNETRRCEFKLLLMMTHALKVISHVIIK